MFMRIFAALFMVIGLLGGFSMLMEAESAPQQLTALIPVIWFYVLGRVFEVLSKDKPLQGKDLEQDDSNQDVKN